MTSTLVPTASSMMPSSSGVLPASTPRVPSTPPPTDPAQDAQTESVAMKAVRRGRSPSAPRRVRGRVAGAMVQSHVDRIEGSTDQQASTPVASGSAVDMQTDYVLAWSDSSAFWTQFSPQEFFADQDND
eukprot:5112670-Amphidinium_carterae.1